MTDFCLEFGTAEDYYVVIHKLSCDCIDHASLLGLGRLARLGNFGSSCMALRSAKIDHPIAARCLDCCISDLIAFDAARHNEPHASFVTM